jgi:hypothetical protein
MINHPKLIVKKLSIPFPRVVCNQCIVNPGNPGCDNAASNTWSSKERGQYRYFIYGGSGGGREGAVRSIIFKIKYTSWAEQSHTRDFL